MADAARMPSKIHNARTPFNSLLPVEIIAEIFLYVLGGPKELPVDPDTCFMDPDGPQYEGVHDHLCPILVVCSFWNEIALQSPRCENPINLPRFRDSCMPGAPLHD